MTAEREAEEGEDPANWELKSRCPRCGITDYRPLLTPHLGAQCLKCGQKYQRVWFYKGPVE